MTRSLADIDLELADEIAGCYADPLKFVLLAYPWGERGPLEKYSGPCPCQRKVLKILGEEVRKRGFDGHTPVAPIRIAVSSGHGIGKSALAAFIADWVYSTRPYAQGTVTANTSTQLETKTWAAIQHWTKLCITAHWFEVTQSRMFRTGHREDWFLASQTCREENSEAFAGQHAATSTSLYINDEGSAIPDMIYEVQEGGLTDGEPIQIIFGNPTRSQGKFHRVMFGGEKDRWRHVVIDSRECPLTNKQQIAEWEEDYGEDSDFFRVRVRGLPPKASDSQFIPLDWVMEAQRREVAVMDDEPLIAGCDLSWGGADYTTIRFRRGHDARSISPVRIPGERTRDPNFLVGEIANILTRAYDGRKVSMLFMDAAGIAGPVASRLRQLGHRNIQEVNFGAHSLDQKHYLMRSYMWGKMKEWLPLGAIDKSAELEEDLTAPGYKHTNKTQLLLEPKDKIRDRIGHSTDDGDALALTFAAPVAAPVQRPQSIITSTAWS